MMERLVGATPSELDSVRDQEQVRDLRSALESRLKNPCDGAERFPVMVAGPTDDFDTVALLVHDVAVEAEETAQTVVLLG